ncbi:unnamed protein product, partial [Rotaria sp. Silwood1]
MRRLRFLPERPLWMISKEIKLWHNEFLRNYPTGKIEKDKFIETYKELYPQCNTLSSC